MIQEELWNQVKALLREMKWTNQYSEWEKSARGEKEIFKKASPYYTQIESDDFLDENIIKEHLQSTNWNPDINCMEWIQEAAFDDIFRTSNGNT